MRLPMPNTRKLNSWRSAIFGKKAWIISARIWGDVWSSMRYYTDYREMFEKEKPEIISIATPTIYMRKLLLMPQQAVPG